MDSIKTSEAFKASMKDRDLAIKIEREKMVEFMRGHALALGVPDNFVLNQKTWDFDPPVEAEKK